jgi:SulP family sulfate permease
MSSTSCPGKARCDGGGTEACCLFLAWRHRVNRATLRLDLLAGLVGADAGAAAGVAFATLAGMPPEYGLYGAMLPAIVGALWARRGILCPAHQRDVLMVFATASAFATPFTPAYVSLVLTLNLMVGLIKLGSASRASARS